MLSYSDLLDATSKFERFDEENLQELAKIITMWKVRSGDLPFPILATLGLVEAKLELLQTENLTERVILSASMAISRFVSITLESETKNNRSEIPQDPKTERTLNSVAHLYQIPKWLIQFRHISTHDELLTDVHLIKHACDICLNWLLVHYWRELCCERAEKSDISNLNFLIDLDSSLSKLIKKFTTSEANFLIKNLKNTNKYNKFIEVLNRRTLTRHELSSFYWSDALFEVIYSNFPLLYFNIISFTLENDSFHYECLKYFGSPQWECFKEDFNNYLNKIKGQHSLTKQQLQFVLSTIHNASNTNHDPIISCLIILILNSIENSSPLLTLYKETISAIQKLCSSTRPYNLSTDTSNMPLELKNKKSSNNVELSYIINGKPFFYIPIGSNFQ